MTPSTPPHSKKSPAASAHMMIGCSHIHPPFSVSLLSIVRMEAAPSAPTPPAPGPVVPIPAPVGPVPTPSSAPEAAAAAAPREAVHVVPLVGDFDRPSLEEGVVQLDGVFHRGRLQKLHVGKALGPARELVAEDGDPVDGPAALEVGLELLRRHLVVHLAHVAVVFVLFWLGGVSRYGSD